MRYSQLFIKTTKENPKDEASRNARLLIRGGFVDKLMAGVYTLMPLGLRVINKIENIIREEMENIGGRELSMPALHPKENWEKSGRWDSMDDLFRLKLDGGKEFALGPTHEEIIVPIAKKFISSYKDLPVYFYQFQNKFRNELRAKSGVMRMREFIMKDLYSFHAGQADLDDYYEKAKEAYGRIFARAGIGNQTYLTYASGGSFSKYSHEFQTLTDAGEDLVHICEKCRVAINKEILADQKHACPLCGSKALREEKAVETGNIFKLGTKFSAPFGLNFKDSEGKEQPVIMGCYGIGLQRLMGAIVEVLSDGKGMVWPEQVAPFKVHLIEIKSKDPAVCQNAESAYERMNEAGVEVLYDDRKETGAGGKFADADLIGCPYRLVISEKTLEDGTVELKKRDDGSLEMISLKHLASRFKNNG
jgi:prolyl-tRNA synthetase